MLILMICVIVELIVPKVAIYLSALEEPVIMIVILLAGLIMLFGAAGMKISNNLLSTVMHGLFRAIGYIFKTLIQALGWCIRNIFMLIPHVFKRSRCAFGKTGMHCTLCNILSALVTLLVVVILI